MTAILPAQQASPEPESRTQGADEELNRLARLLSDERRKLEKMKAESRVPGALDAFSAWMTADLAHLDKMKDATREARASLPITMGFLAATESMSLGRFDEARERLTAYAKSEPGDRLAAFALALCHVEMRDFVAGGSCLRAAFPEDDKHPAVRALRYVCEEASRHGASPTDAQVLESFDLGAARFQCEVEAQGEHRLLFSNPLTTDPVLLRTLGVDREEMPMALRPTRLEDAAARLGQPWPYLVASRILDPDALIAKSTGAEPGASRGEHAKLTPEELVCDALMYWYGPVGRYRVDSAERRGGIEKLRKLEPENGLWKLLEIPFAEARTLDEDPLAPFKPLDDEELETLMAAAGAGSIEVRSQAWIKATADLRREMKYPYREVFEPMARPPFQMAFHAANVLRRAQRSVDERLRQKDDRTAEQIARAVASIVDHARFEEGSLGGEMLSNMWRILALETTALVAESDEHLAQTLDAWARQELHGAAMLHVGLCDGLFATALPVRLREDVAFGKWSSAELRARAKLVLDACPAERTRRKELLSLAYVRPKIILAALLSGDAELISVIIEHVDDYGVDAQWQAAWVLGQVDGLETTAKLRELAKADSRNVRVVAKAALKRRANK